MVSRTDTTWEELPELLRRTVDRLDPRERKKRVQLLVTQTDQQAVVAVEASGGALTPGEREEWIGKFKAWAESHEPLGHEVDDGRESIYAGTIGDLA